MLIFVLGWHALVWLVLLQLGVGVSVLCTLIATLLVIRYLIPRERVKTRIGVAAALGLMIVLIAISLLDLELPGQPQGSTLAPTMTGLR